MKHFTCVALLIVLVAIVGIQGQTTENILQRFSARKCVNKPTCGQGEKFRAFVYDGLTCPEVPRATPGTRQKVCKSGASPFTKICGYCIKKADRSISQRKVCDLSCDTPNGKPGCQCS